MTSISSNSFCLHAPNDGEATLGVSSRPEAVGDAATEARLNELMSWLYALEDGPLEADAGAQVSPFTQVAEAKTWVAWCMRRLQHDWESDQRSYNEVTAAFRRLEQALRRGLREGLASRPRAGLPALGRALVVTAPGCSHAMGATLVAAHFEAQGWYVESPEVSHARDVLEAVRAAHVDVLGMSVGHDHALLDLAQLIRDLRRVSANPGLKILLGGQAFSLGKSEYQWLAADHIATDEHDAFQFCNSMMLSHRH